MIILPSRNGMLLRNSNGILAADCGGPVEFTCPCTLLTGDNSDCFDTDCTPSTCIVSTTEDSYCLNYVTGSTWQKTIGSKVITLNLESASETASVTIVDGGTTVFSGTNTGTSCIHRWTGSMSNTITPDTIGDVSYSTDCEQPEFDCDCNLLPSTVCSCFGNNSTPSSYIVDFGDSGKYCLDHISGCTWQKTVGTITVTLNLTYTTNTTRLTVVDGSTTVFSGDLVAASCNGRKYGAISNTVSPSDWGDALFTAECLETACWNGRLVHIEIDFGREIILGQGISNPYFSYDVAVWSRTASVYGYATEILEGKPDTCGLNGVLAGSRVYTAYRHDCSIYMQNEDYLGQFFVLFNPTNKRWSISFNIGGIQRFYGEIVKDINDIGIGESIYVSNIRELRAGPPWIPCDDCEFIIGGTGAIVPVGGIAKVTVY